ncbi:MULTISPECIES: type II toxin-antitoxin system HipA family toxin [Pseudomonas]|uniref:type II toxin-antitoxin system HipA family toxin n=1 Tax=Pseudomonas TaxID=286 RepID=UPI000F020AF8|nr:type II toxin-antitoxin system HipA family toxin [Pseudomonas viridiflava]MBD8615537.1 type II toxin-antitoxin system HipA family toxin [Pseudomonas putida]MBD8681811.1 type II toxin-antitoxin system HipA family toxin [Pseudomonas sp. CFBP 13719]
MKIKRVKVSVPQGDSGRLSKGAQYVFDYFDENAQDREVSLTQPGSQSPFVKNFLQPIFTMNLPEGYLAEKIRQRMAKTPYNDLFLLSLIGDNQIGRLSYSSDEFSPAPRQAQVGLGDILSASTPGEIFEFLVTQYFASGVSGVQPKVLAPDKDDEAFGRKTLIASNLIVKSGLEEYEALSQNEFLCMEAARLSGMSTPEFFLSDNRELFVMKRFDLEAEKRLGFEDISVLLDIPVESTGNYKYTRSYETIAKVIQAVCPGDWGQVTKFFEYLCLSLMVRNGDAHLKNFGILYEHPGEEGGRRLSPIYDVTTTSIYPHYSSKFMREVFDDSMALRLRDGDKHRNYPTRDELIKFGREVVMLKRPERVIDRIAEGMRQALALNKDRVDSTLHTKMSGEWDKGIFLAINPSAAKRTAGRPSSGGQTKARNQSEDTQL